MKRLFKNNWEYLLIGIIGIFIIGVFALGVNFQTARADSGWDSDYDSGGGWSSSDSGGSWDSSDSWSSSGYDYDSYSGGSGGEVFTMLVFAVIIVIIILAVNSNKYNEPPDVYSYESKTKSEIRRQDISQADVKAILPDEDLGSLKHMAFGKFVEIQKAWMDFNYDMLRVLCTDELYNTYKTQLETLQIKNGKNIMTQFDQEEIRIIDVTEENDMVTVRVYLRVTFYDYVINNKSKEVIRGQKDHPLTNNYEMEFVRKKNTEKRQIKCPNCGAKVFVVTSKKCEYCNTTIVAPASEFVLSKKTNVNKK